MERILDFKCEECKHTFDKKFKSGQKVKDRYNCPKCKSSKSCYRDWSGVGTVIPEHMKATSKFKEAVQTRDRFKKYKGQNGTKRLYQGGGVDK